MAWAAASLGEQPPSAMILVNSFLTAASKAALAWAVRPLLDCSSRCATPTFRPARKGVCQSHRWPANKHLLASGLQEALRQVCRTAEAACDLGGGWTHDLVCRRVLRRGC